MSVFLYGLAVVALLLTGSASTPEVANGENCPAIDHPPPALRVFVDRRTGKIRPPEAGEAAKLFAVAAREARTYQVVVLPDGTKIVELDDAFMNYFVIERAPDGSVHSRCVTEGSGAAARPVP
jgi:hypothetical protein